MPDKKVSSLLLAALLLSTVAFAQDAVELNPDHPTRYIVKRGDTLWDISRKYNISIASLKRLNKKSTSKIKPGELLKVAEK